MNTTTHPFTTKGKKLLPKNGNRPAGDRKEDFDEASLLLDAMLAFRDGNFSARLPSNWTGVHGKIADVFNETIYIAERLNAETARVSRAVGKEGKLKQRMVLAGATGHWATKVESINMLIHDLVWPTAEVTPTIGAVARGDLGQPMALEVDGRPLEGAFLRNA